MTSASHLDAGALSVNVGLDLGLSPSTCLFLDDDPSYVAAAIALGYQGLAVLRQPGQTAGGVPSIRSIDAILDRF